LHVSRLDPTYAIANASTGGVANAIFYANAYTNAYASCSWGVEYFWDVVDVG